MICINTAWAGDLAQIRRSARSWHTKTVQQIQRMDLVMSPLVCEKTNMELITHSQVVRNICDRIPRFPAVKFCYTLLHVMSNAWPDADLALLEATPTRSHVPRTCSWNHIPNPQATHSCITEALVTTSVEEHRLTSVYWFPTGFDLGVKAINKCEVATISCGGEVSHYWAERFKLQWEWLSETGAVYRWGSAHLYKAGASLNANVLMPRVWVCVCVYNVNASHWKGMLICFSVVRVLNLSNRTDEGCATAPEHPTVLSFTSVPLSVTVAALLFVTGRRRSEHWRVWADSGICYQGNRYPEWFRG